MREILFKAKTNGYSKSEWVFGYQSLYEADNDDFYIVRNIFDGVVKQ
jgi:hypothetical protein